jgi:plasmid maintenance system antidote protein VapI
MSRDDLERELGPGTLARFDAFVADGQDSRASVDGAVSFVPVHPGRLLQLMLAKRNLSEAEVARRANLSVEELAQIVAGKIAVDRQISKKLSHVFGAEVGRTLHNMQRLFDHYELTGELPETVVKSKWAAFA